MELSPEFYKELSFKAGSVFTPSSPIDQKTLFAGRTKEVRRVIDVLNQKGQHAIIFGERGVGKTSLARVISEFFDNPELRVPNVTCDSGDNYETVWKKIFEKMSLVSRTRKMGFLGLEDDKQISFLTQVSDYIKPGEVIKRLEEISLHVPLMIVIDEFDRITDPGVRKLFSDTIKILSDNSIDVTIILVGVAGTVSELIIGHESVSRALIEIQVPKMSEIELRQILEIGAKKLNPQIKFSEDAIKKTTSLSQGFPHYAHLLALNSVRFSLDDNRLNVETLDVDSAIDKALEDAQDSIRRSCHAATVSPRKDNLYLHVLVACALASKDDLGYFAPADVREPMSRIMHKNFSIPRFARHLNDLYEGRGCVLDRMGSERKYRYRFKDPLMQSYVIMQGLKKGLVTTEILS